MMVHQEVCKKRLPGYTRLDNATLSRAHSYVLPEKDVNNFCTVSRSLTPSVASTLVHALIISCLDYYSTLYTGLPACRLSCLDRVLRSAACLIGKIQKYDHVTRYKLC